MTITASSARDTSLVSSSAKAARHTLRRAALFYAPARRRIMIATIMRNFPIIDRTLQTATRNQMLEITDAVRRLVVQNEINSGIAVVAVPHTTACVAFLPSAAYDA